MLRVHSNACGWALGPALALILLTPGGAVRGSDPPAHPNPTVPAVDVRGLLRDGAYGDVEASSRAHERLAQLRNESAAVDTVAAALSDDDVRICDVSARVLCDMGSTYAIEALTGTVGTGNPRARWQALESLMRIGDVRSKDAVLWGYLSFLCDGHPATRWRAATILGDLGDKRAIEPLVPVLTDHLLPRSAAAEALLKLGWKAENRGERVRYSIATTAWADVGRQANTSDPPKERRDAVEGRVEIGVPILLQLSDYGTGVWKDGKVAPEPETGSIPWIEFTVTDKRYHARVELGCPSYPKKAFKVTVGLWDDAGVLLDCAEEGFETTGSSLDLPEWELYVTRLYFSATTKLSRTTRYSVQVESRP